MTDEDWLTMLRCAQDRGLYIESADRNTGRVVLCGPCSAHLPCPRHRRVTVHREWSED